MSARQRLPAGEPRKGSRGAPRRAEEARVSNVWRPGDHPDEKREHALTAKSAVTKLVKQSQYWTFCCGVAVPATMAELFSKIFADTSGVIAPDLRVTRLSLVPTYAASAAISASRLRRASDCAHDFLKRLTTVENRLDAFIIALSASPVNAMADRRQKLVWWNLHHAPIMKEADSDFSADETAPPSPHRQAATPSIVLPDALSRCRRRVLSPF
jgi:hypothetical protein